MDEYKKYKIILDDFIKEVLDKNNINDPIDIFHVYCKLYKNKTFSKDTKLDYFYDEVNHLSDKNYDNEYLSDAMVGFKKDKYLGMFMVNGDGVCRHINYMLADILNKKGYKTFILYGTPNSNKEIKHLICGVLDKNNNIIYLDATNEKILYETKRNNFITTATVRCNYDLKRIDYEMTVTDYYQLSKINQFTNYKSKYNNYKDIYDLENNKINVDEKILKDANKYRIKHLLLFQDISKVLHKKYDPKEDKKTLRLN